MAKGDTSHAPPGMNKPHKEYTFSYGHKVVGTMYDGVVTKHVKKSQHLYRKLDAWSIDKKAFQDWREFGLQYLVIIDDESETEYRASAEMFEAHAQEIDHGHGVQWALPRKHWSKT